MIQYLYQRCSVFLIIWKYHFYLMLLLILDDIQDLEDGLENKTRGFDTQLIKALSPQFSNILKRLGTLSCLNYFEQFINTK